MLHKARRRRRSSISLPPQALGPRGVVLVAANAAVNTGDRYGQTHRHAVDPFVAGATTDADRNCVSNIRPEGLAPYIAADKVARLLAAAYQKGLTGVGLKDETEALLLIDRSRDEV